MEKSFPEKPVADVSMVVPNYNNGRFLAMFIESVLQSTMWPAELILVDDGSTDNSCEVLESFSSVPFLKIVKLPENRGLPTALNTGLDLAVSRYILRADPDDLLMPDRIERQYQYMETHPEIDVLGSNVIYFNHETGKETNVSNFPATHDEIVRLLRAGINGIQHPTVTIRRIALGSLRYENISPGEDYALFSTLAVRGRRLASLPEPLYRMRIHGASSVSNISLNAVKQIFMARDRIWKTKTSIFRVYGYFFFIYHYRKSQLEKNKLLKIFYLATAGLFFPQRVFIAIFVK
jgi:glycosyltransferase involved in cell wall biosynthesis